MTKPTWVYPEGHEPGWLDCSGADRDPQLREMELQAEIRNNAGEAWVLRGLVCLIMVVGVLVWLTAD